MQLVTAPAHTQTTQTRRLVLNSHQVILCFLIGTAIRYKPPEWRKRAFLWKMRSNFNTRELNARQVI